MKWHPQAALNFRNQPQTHKTLYWPINQSIKFRRKMIRAKATTTLEIQFEYAVNPFGQDLYLVLLRNCAK